MKLEAEHARALAESAQKQLAAATAGDDTPESIVSSPFSVRDLLEQNHTYGCRDSQNNQPRPQLRATEDPRRHRLFASRGEILGGEMETQLNAYVDARLVMQRDDHYLGAIESFFTPQLQKYLHTRYYTKNSTPEA